MFIFIFNAQKYVPVLHCYLHSTMFIFISSFAARYSSKVIIYIPLCLYLYDDSNILSALTYLFTFHYVYIYMQNDPNIPLQKYHLHSTMFIFIL